MKNKCVQTLVNKIEREFAFLLLASLFPRMILNYFISAFTSKFKQVLQSEISVIFLIKSALYEVFIQVPLSWPLVIFFEWPLFESSSEVIENRHF